MLKTNNSIVMEGNLVRDPTANTTPNGAKVCKFSLANNRYYTMNNEKRSEVSFFDVEVWNQTAQRCMEALTKGKQVRVAGRLKQDRWMDDDGKQHSRIKIVGNDVQFFGQSSDEEESEGQFAQEDAQERELVPAF